MGRIALPVLLCMATGASAQGPCTFDLGPDHVLCAGQEVPLTAPAGLDTYDWNTGATTPGIVVSAPGTYWCTVTRTVAGEGNVVVNGGFDAGTSGFTSDYAEPTVPGPYGLLSDEGQFAVTTDPVLAHIDFSSCGDHTSGAGNMLVVNGAALSGADIWCQEVTVQPSTTYSFSAWLMTAFPANPATLGFMVDGVTIGVPLDAPDVPCNWQQFAASWTSGLATTATICIVNLNTEIFGNDFALDDISFTGGTSLCTFTDTVVVVPFQGALDLGPDLTACEGSTLTLGAGAEVEWSTGTIGATLTVDAPGTYWAVLEEEGCAARDSVDVLFVPGPAVDLPDTLVLCAGLYVTMDAGWPGATQLWNTGATDPVLTVDSAGAYSVAVTAEGCTLHDTVVVHTPAPLALFAPVLDAELCPGATVVLTAPAIPGVVQTWDTGETGASIIVGHRGVHTVVSVGACEQRTDTIAAVLGDCDTFLHVPNAFTPNGDGVNDAFLPVLYGPGEPYMLDIFDRWGEHILHSEDRLQAWDGTYKGAPVPDGVYIWKVAYRDIEDISVEERQVLGHVTVLR